MKDFSPILQIVPGSIGSPGGVADYALTLAAKLRKDYGRRTVFAAAAPASTAGVDDFEVYPLDRLSERDTGPVNCDHIILHYVNYGYQKRGVPFRLLSILSTLRGKCPGRFLTIFHELYASGSPRQSAFWLQPFQKRIARSISRLSDACIVSNEPVLAQLRRLNPDVRASIQPVFSNLGEPSLSSEQIATRDPHRWIICGGTALLEQSLRSFRAIMSRIPEPFCPRELFLLGGSDNPAVRSILAELPDLRSHYRPQIGAGEASQILSTCSLAWLDYFHRRDVPTAAVLKSGAFAAACAHGIIPIFPHPGSAISLHGDSLPGPFFVDSNFCELPAANDRAKVAAEFYDWYQRCASSEHLTRAIASALDLIQDRDVPSGDKSRQQRAS